VVQATAEQLAAADFLARPHPDVAERRPGWYVWPDLTSEQESRLGAADMECGQDPQGRAGGAHKK
jgi:hypothetical protein